MNTWSLPKTATIGGKQYSLNTDFRDVLEIIRYLTDENRPMYMRWRIAIGLFFDQEVPEEYHQEAMQYLSDFISYGAQDSKPGPKLIDWEQDANLIVGEVNKVAGCEIRSIPFVHWWTFLSYFQGIGEGQLSTVVSIRKKKAQRKKLEKWEQEFYSANKTMIDLKTKETEEERRIKEQMILWLDGKK